jgi:hypothetical protein
VAEEIQACVAKHLALQHCEAIDVPLDRSSTPGPRDAGFDRGIVLIQPSGEAAYGLHRPGGRARELGIALRRLPRAAQGRKILREVDRLVHLGVLRTPLGTLACLVCGALVLAPEDEPGGPTRRKGLP